MRRGAFDYLVIRFYEGEKERMREREKEQRSVEL
jgi:hypothetical protein